MTPFLDIAEEPSSPDSFQQVPTVDLTSPPHRNTIIVDDSIESRSTKVAGTLENMSSCPTVARDRTIRMASSSSNSTMSSDLAESTNLPPLQMRAAGDVEGLEPLADEDLQPGDFDLVPKPPLNTSKYSLEARSEILFSKEHMATIFSDPTLASAFNRFLHLYRPASVPLLNYYFDALKALKAIAYSNAIQHDLEPLAGQRFGLSADHVTLNPMLQEMAEKAFSALAQEELPRFITYTWCQTVRDSVQIRIIGKMQSHLLSMSEGLGEVFCLSDPSRDDNPVIFASEEFHRTTQYGHDFVIGRNCRFLQGPKTNSFSIKRIRDEIRADRPHCEAVLNYRRDGSPFMNLLMTAPLVDSMGKVRYYLGAQVDVSGLVKGNVGLPSLERLVSGNGLKRESPDGERADTRAADEFRGLSEMFNKFEIETANWHRSRILIQDDMSHPNLDSLPNAIDASQGPLANGGLTGFYDHYLLVRRPPSLRILFVSPSLRMPGMLQSPFLSRIGGSSRVREELSEALSYSTSITAKVRWISRGDPDGRPRWIHCTPLLGVNREVGAWVVVLVDDDDQPRARRKMAPPIEEIEHNPSVDFADSFESSRFEESALWPFDAQQGAGPRGSWDSSE